MTEIIALSAATIGGEEIQTVNARDLHAFLGVKTEFKDWIARRIKDFGFVENTDFCSFLSESSAVCVTDKFVQNSTYFNLDKNVRVLLMVKNA